MSQHTQSAAHRGHLTYLPGQEKADPYQVLEDFFCDTNLAEITDLFDKISETCLTTDDGPFSKGEERGQLLFLRKKIEAVLGAYLLIRNSKEAA